MNSPIIKGSAGNLYRFASVPVTNRKFIPQNETTIINNTSNVKSGF